MEIPILQGCITRFTRPICLRRLVELALFTAVTIVIVPLAIGMMVGIPISTGFLLISSTLTLQGAVGMVGIGLGMNPVHILLITTSIAIGCMYGIYEACDLFAQSSPRISGWLKKVENRTKNATYLTRYGPVMLIPIIWIPGISLFGSPVVGWVFRWNRWLSILCMTIGWMIAISVVMAGSMGLVQMFF